MCLNDFKNLLIQIDVATNKKYYLQLPKSDHDILINQIETQIPYFLSIIVGIISFCLGIILACTGVYYLTQALQVLTSFFLALILNFIIVYEILRVDKGVVGIITFFLFLTCLACLSKRIAQFCLPYAIPFLTGIVFLGFSELIFFYIDYISY